MTTTHEHASTATTADVGRRRLPGLEILAVALVAAVLLRPYLAGFLDQPALQTFSTIFVSIFVQALPFLVLGVAVSGAIAAFVPASFVARALPRSALLSVPLAGAAGMALPGCECGSVPIAGRLTASGMTPAAALTFMLSAPAINPVVLAATAVAFPDEPRLVIARLVASLVAAIVVGWVWSRFGSTELTRASRAHLHGGDSRWQTFALASRHDLLHAGGWLVLGGMVAATLQVLVPRTVLDTLGGNEWIAVPVMAALAIVLAICSEADAFVATGLTQFSLTSRLVFLVVGPAIDVKLIALQAGVFGRDFVVRFAPLVVAVTVTVAVLVGMVIL